MKRAALILGKCYDISTATKVRKALDILKIEGSGHVVKPSLFKSILYQGEQATRTEHWQTPRELERSLVGDCEDIANWAAQGLRQRGLRAETVIVRHPDYLHIIVWCEGYLLDPCFSRGMRIDPIYRDICNKKGITLV